MNLNRPKDDHAKHAHLIAGILAPLCIATFFLPTIQAGLFGRRPERTQRAGQVKSFGLTATPPRNWLEAVLALRMRRRRLEQAAHSRL